MTTKAVPYEEWKQNMKIAYDLQQNKIETFDEYIAFMESILQSKDLIIIDEGKKYVLL